MAWSTSDWAGVSRSIGDEAQTEATKNGQRCVETARDRWPAVRPWCPVGVGGSLTVRHHAVPEGVQLADVVEGRAAGFMTADSLAGNAVCSFNIE